MKHIAILNPKGGCGKTTIATHLAVYASTLGLDVALADHDPQHSSHDWMKARPQRCADLDLIAAYRGDAVGRDYDVVIHDFPAGDLAVSQLPLDVCSKVIIPLMPSPIDLKAALQLWIKLSEQGWLDSSSVDFSIVANRVKSNTRYLQTFDAFIEKLDIPRVATLRDTQNYIRSMDNGLTLFDLPPGQVVKDLVQWEPLMDWTGFFDFEEDISDLMQVLSGESDGMFDAAFDSGFNNNHAVATAAPIASGGAGAARSASANEAELDDALMKALATLSKQELPEGEIAQPVSSAEFSKGSVPVESARTSFLKKSGADGFSELATSDSSTSDEGYDWQRVMADGEESADFISLDDYHAEQLEEEREVDAYNQYD